MEPQVTTLDSVAVFSRVKIEYKISINYGHGRFRKRGGQSEKTT